MKIEGEYTISATFTRMFQQYTIPLVTGHNLVTNSGILFFMERIIGSTTDTMYEICLGKDAIHTPKNTDTSMENEVSQVAPAIGIEETQNQIVLQSTILTDDMEGINEIGVRTEGNLETGESGILISHDLFKPLSDLSITATFILKYTFTFLNETTDINWTVTQEDNIYYTNYDSIITEIINNENTQLKQYNNYEDMSENTYSYYFENSILYVNTPKNPIQEELSII